jgi:uncharacterized protein
LRIEAHSDIEAFARLARPLLSAQEALYCLPLGILHSLLHDPGRYSRAVLLSVHDRTDLIGIAWMTPPHPFGLTAMEAGVLDELARFCTTLAEPLSGAVGPVPAVDEFARAWLRLTSRKPVSIMRQCIYQLERVQPAERPAALGAMRFATEADRDLLDAWHLAFARDCGLPASDAYVRELTAQAIRLSNRVLWEEAGRTVSMAGFGGRTPSGIRISYVYTPPDARARGYASALVAALSQHLLDTGLAFCFLYTDLANPTSNRIYQRIGYRSIGQSAHHTFE